MKKVNKSLVGCPRNLKVGWSAYDNAIGTLERQKKWPNTFSKIYNSSTVRGKLDNIYHGKCAYCNQIPKGSPLQVDHFRPKDGIKNEAHSGYYWLGYEWTNLLFSCGNCNGYKSNKFPLFRGVDRLDGPTWVVNTNKLDLDNSLITSTILSNEKHFLINPEIDNPEKHLLYETDGKIGYRDIRGKISICVYKLNRDELHLDGRKQLLDKIILRIAKILDKIETENRTMESVKSDIVDVIVEEIIVPIENKKSFDHFRKTIFDNYDIYITPRIVKDHHKVILNSILGELSMGLKLTIN